MSIFKNIQNKKKKAYLFGISSEIIVIIILTLKLYKILQWRYRCIYGEIDIIAKKGKNIFFIEVKSRKHYESFSENLISRKQIKRISNSASFYISRNKHFSNYNARFDLVFISSSFKYKYVANAWQIS